MDVSDEQLMSGIASGDVGAFTTLYDRHSPRVFGLLSRLLRHRGGAEDVLQETFCQAWTSAKRYDLARSSPLVWLLLIARSKAIDHLRRRGDAAPAARHEPATSADASRDAEWNELAASVRGGLAELSDEQRIAVTLAFYEGLTHQEIARRQSIPLGTAKTRIRLGIQRLRDYLSHYQEDAA